MGKGLGKIQSSILEVLRSIGIEGMLAADIAKRIFGDKPTASNMASLRRALASLLADGSLVHDERLWWFHSIWDEALARAMDACRAEKVTAPDNADDETYNRGIEHCIEAIAMTSSLGVTSAFAAVFGEPKPDCIDPDFVVSDIQNLHVLGLAGYDIWEVEIRLVRKLETNPEHFPGDLS